MIRILGFPSQFIFITIPHRLPQVIVLFDMLSHVCLAGLYLFADITNAPSATDIVLVAIALLDYLFLAQFFRRLFPYFNLCS